MSATRTWADATVEGFRAMSAGRYADVADLWIGALDLVDQANPDDLRLAAGQSNAGVGNILLRRMDQADVLLEAAERAWARIAVLIETLDVPVVGTSSSFHFSLASRNLTAFEGIRRKRLARLCEGSLAITRFNRLLTSEQPPMRARVEEAGRGLARILSGILGPNAPEVRLLSLSGSGSGTPTAGAEDAPYEEKAAAFVQRGPTLSDALSETCRTLDTVFALTALLGLPQVSRVLPSGPAAR